MTDDFDDQIEIFPTPVLIERLDPRRFAGERTQADALYRVRIGDPAPAHMVFMDRHGIYCQDHGPDCRAAREVRSRLDSGPAQRGLDL